MRARAERRWASAVMAPVAGIGLASGRAIALFFGQLKSAAWAGVLMASAWFGLMAGAIAWSCARGGANEASAASAAVLPRLLELLRDLFAMLALSMMLARAGELGALALPVRHGYGLGALMAFAAAVGVGRQPARVMPGLGCAVFCAALLFYAAMALDPRPVAPRVRGETELLLAGSYRAALWLALLFASMNGCAAAWAGAVPVGPARPAAIGARAGLGMLLALTLACAALRRGGDVILAQEQPWTLLSARWGKAGFWLCAAVEYACAAATASGAMSRFLARVRAGGRGRAQAGFVLLAGAVLFFVISYGRMQP